MHETLPGPAGEGMMEVHLPPQVLGLLQDYGDLAIFVALLLESCGLPLPGEIMLISGGTLAASGVINPLFFFLSAFCAAVIGDNIGFAIGRFIGRQAIIRHGSRIGLTEDRYAWAEAQFERFGPLVVAGARFVAILRQINGIVAGSLGMHWLHFTICNAIGAALWVGFWGIVSMFLGAYLPVVLGFVHHVSFAAGIVLIVAIAGWVAYRFRRQQGDTNS